MCGPARNPNFHATVVVPVCDQMRPLAGYAEESEGKPLDVDRRAIPGARDCDPFAVLTAEHVELVPVDPVCNQILKGHVYDICSLVSTGAGTPTKLDCAVAVIDVEGGLPRDFLHHFGKYVSMWYVVVG